MLTSRLICELRSAILHYCLICNGFWIEDKLFILIIVDRSSIGTRGDFVGHVILIALVVSRGDLALYNKLMENVFSLPDDVIKL